MVAVSVFVAAVAVAAVSAFVLKFRYKSTNHKWSE